MKKYRLVTVFLVAIMTTAILSVVAPLTSADPWSYNRGPPIVIDGSIGDWDPIKPLNTDPIGDTEPWSWNGTTMLAPGLNDSWYWPMFPDQVRDLKALYMWFDPSTDIYVRLDVAGMPSPGWGIGPFGPANVSAYLMYISTNLTAGAGGIVGFYDGLAFLPPCEWEFILAFSEWWAILGGWNGTGFEAIDATPSAVPLLNATPPYFYGIPNLTLAVDYANAAIELYMPRADFRTWWYNADLEIASIVVTSIKGGLVGNASAGEYPFLHPFDPQAVLAGTSPPIAGEEFFQPSSNGPDHADIMAPSSVGPGQPYLPGYHEVLDQKLVDMSVGAKIHAYDAATGQQNITDTYSLGQQFTINIDIVDAINLTGVSLGLTWDPTVLECLSFTTLFGAGTFLGPSGDWIGLDGTIDNVAGQVFPPSGFAFTGATPPSGSGTLVEVVFNVTAPFGSTWICPVDWGTEFQLSSLGKVIIEIPVKNAWFLRSPPPPGPPTLSYTQDPAAPPHYPGDTITFDLSGSSPGFNGTHYVPIVNYSFTVWNSSGKVYEYLGPDPVNNFTPVTVDTYIFGLDIHLDPNFDPAYSAAHPDWLVVEQNVTKTVIEKALTGIDCYTSQYRFSGYVTPFMGKGWNASADAYALDEVVTVYSYVFYNGWPKQSFLVSYEVYDANGTLVLVRNAMTNASGIANMSFRILTVCLNPEYAFGKWRIFQKVYMSDEPYNDTLWFDVGWLVELETVTPAQSVYYVGDPVGDHMTFTITGKSISQIPRNVTWAVTVYDDEDVPIAVTTGKVVINPGRFCDPEPFELVIDCLTIPKWTYPGVAKVYVNAWFNALPTGSGHPTSPEISALFIISAP